jgi:5'-nucleotidase
MRILATNDDGIRAEGLWTLASELSRIAEVVVVAPDRDHSGAGTSVTLRQPLRITRIESPVQAIPAYSVEGTPADSVILAINAILRGKNIDFVVSGVNEGPNLGDDVFISGTVGAALQGYLRGIPSIALSVAGSGALHFEVAARVARILVSSITMADLSHRLLLNINLPNSELRALKGIEVTRLGERKYPDGIESRYDAERDYYRIIRGNSEWHAPAGTDVWAIRQGLISLTPFPVAGAIESMTQWEFFQQLAIHVYHELLNEAKKEV